MSLEGCTEANYWGWMNWTNPRKFDVVAALNDLTGDVSAKGGVAHTARWG